MNEFAKRCGWCSCLVMLAGAMNQRAAAEGACCRPANCIPATDATECDVFGGVFLDGEDCADSPCEIGACCFELNCGMLDAFNCISSGRAFGGAGTTCLDDPCESNIGACCNSGTCSFVSPLQCGNEGGTWLGAGTNCQTSPCDIGACCQPGACADLPGFECMATGGTFVNGFSCSADACEQTLGCPADSLFSQSRDAPLFFASYLSESSQNAQRSDNYANLPGAIAVVRWFALSLAFDGAAFSDCVDSSPIFEITFHENNAGTLGEVVCSYTIEAQRTFTGIPYQTFEAVKYEAILPTPCVASTGWISIVGLGDPDCRHYWISSTDGDQASLCSNCPGGPNVADDFNFCLLGNAGGVFGACCDQNMGFCSENVEIQDCLDVGQFFAPDKTCAELDQPCEIVRGACCFNNGTPCSIEVEGDCVAAGGSWLGRDTVCEQCPAVGACCLAQDACFIGTENNCGDAGFSFIGADTACEDCPPLPDCPADTLFGQTVDGPNDFLSGTSEASAGFARFEDFAGVAGPIEHITFWGLDLDNIEGTNDFVECVEDDPQFEIAFHRDANGVPGEQVCSYTVLAERIPTLFDYLGANVIEFRAVLPASCVLTRGWVKIVGLGDEDCWFLWLSAGLGGSLCEGCSVEQQDDDFAFCLNGPVGGVTGACCVDETGQCEENVDIADCAQSTQRFRPGTACADLDPPCGIILGACCFSDATCSLSEEVSCQKSGGDWLGANSICDSCPCITPCPSVGVAEGEPVCFDDYDDVFNGGCDAETVGFSPIGFGQTVCGLSGVFVVDFDFVGDFDWFEIEVAEPTMLTWIVEAEFPAVVGVVDGTAGCAGANVITLQSTDECDPLEITVPVNAGTYWLVVGPLAATDLAACGKRYTAVVLNANAPPGDGNGDGNVDLFDLDLWNACLASPGSTAPPACLVFDFDGDQDVDWADNAVFQQLFGGR